MSRLPVLSIVIFITACQLNDNKSLLTEPSHSFKLTGDIEPPKGYKRVEYAKDSFGTWLRNIAIKKDTHVYLYDGSLKKNQSAQFAVLDITIGKKDLQQCADAVMRLRAEYLFSQKRYADIQFFDNEGKAYKWTGGADRAGFDRYLEHVFGWCGSASLAKQLKPAAQIKDIQPGDVFIKGGFPGHAMIVMDVAINDKGDKVFMLAQSYMPAQDIHIVRNPVNDRASPWYEIGDTKEITTPEWEFTIDQLRRW
jgi:Domain of unknown function (4846)